MKLRRLARLALVVIPFAGAVAPMSLPRLANAATTIVVDTFVEVATPDCTLGHAASTCSLRGAILQANGDTGDIVSLPAGTYTLSSLAVGQTDDATSGDLEIQSTMTLQGAGATTTIIQGAPAWDDRIIEADNSSNSSTVTIQDLKVTGGHDTGQYGEVDGGAILNDGDSLTLHNVIVDTNQSDTDGGGVASDTNTAQTFTISNSTLTNNTAANNGGGLWVGGNTSGVDSASNLFITNNTANGGTPEDAGGGGIYNDLADASGTGSISFSDLMVVGNHATAMGGGGVYDNANLTTPATLAVRRPVIYQRITIAGNDAKIVGGGFYTARSDTILTNATINNNTIPNTGQTAVVDNGGGIAAGIPPAQISVNNATINGNTSPGAGAGAYVGNNLDRIHLHNTILVKNTSGTGSSDCFKQGLPAGVIDSTGYNIVDDATCALVRAGDREGSSFNPNLGALQDNTGPLDGAPGDTSPTLTEALPTGSIAIDTADPAGANNPATDERGVTRPQGAQSDVGAYEAIPPVVVAPVLPAAGHLPSGPLSSTVWALLILAATTAVAAARLGVRARARNPSQSLLPVIDHWPERQLFAGGLPEFDMSRSVRHDSISRGHHLPRDGKEFE